MDKSFTSWRQPGKEVELPDSESDTDVIEGSNEILAPDSDEEPVGLVKNELKIGEIIVSSSSEDESRRSTSTDKFLRGSIDQNRPNVRISSPEEPIVIKKKSKNRQIIESDDEASVTESANFHISDSNSDEEVVKHGQIKESSIDDSFLFKNDTICSSTRIVSGDISILSADTFVTDKSESHSSTDGSFRSPVVSKKSILPTIDLTSSKKSFPKKIDSVNLKEGLKIENSSGAVIIDSDSGEDESKKTSQFSANESQLVNKLSLVKISPSASSHLGHFSSANIKKNNENDYVSRIESLKAEEAKLNAQVAEVLKNISTAKDTLKSANLSALPDKGVRLQMYIKKQETQLRDLRYQQSTLSNEILKFQLSSKGVPKPIVHQPNQKMFKLPTTNTDLNAMGKRAMEVHRTQQALTIDALRVLHNSLKNCPSEDTYTTDPRGLRVELMPHQKHALAWLLWREKERPSGGILADDMGLGKTLTMISLIMKVNETDTEDDGSENSDKESGKENSDLFSKHSKTIKGKTLIVCPASLIDQWEREIQTKVKRGTLDSVVHHGQSREKKPKRLAKPDVVITTYSIVGRDASALESPLFQIRWARIILDEAHQIRNHKTQTAQAVFRLKGKCRWALTGTPVHNKELDLYALIKFLRCSPFDDLAVWKKWVDNKDAAGMQRLNTITKSLMLRRTKKGLQEVGELKSLTEKKFHTIFVKMDEKESEVYQKLLEFSKTLFAQFLHQKAEKEDALKGVPLKPAKGSNYLNNVEDPFENHPELARLHRQMKKIPDVKSHHILVLLLRLRQFCCHPSLIKSMLDKEDVANDGIEDADGLDLDLMEKLTNLSLQREEEPNTETSEVVVSTLDKENALFAVDRLSSKVIKVLETVQAVVRSDDKLLIVSQWVTLLDVVHEFLKAQKVKCTMLTGKVPIKDRGDIVERFNRKGHGPKIMLLSLTAGGVGLNLVGANHLILLDLHWNPQLESQACDRIYRVGQEKNVHIYKFVSSETIEEQILKLQQKKLEVADSVLTGSRNASKLSLEDLKMLFQITK